VTSSSTTTIGTSATVGTGWSGTGGTVGSGGAGGGTVGDCPASQPANGSSCASPSQVCNYPYCGFASGMSYECVAGKWSMRSTPSCNPPPPQLPCPATEPAAGSGCSAVQYQSKTCPYPVTCCGIPGGQVTYECALALNQWRKISSDGGVADAGGCFQPPPSCPSTAPYDGQPCCFNAPMTSACFYGCRLNPDGGGLASPTAFCDGKQWRVSYGSCPVYDATVNPPAPDSSWRGDPNDAGGGRDGWPD
jgi:hypothetical protein